MRAALHRDVRRVVATAAADEASLLLPWSACGREKQNK
jgi:hypothetical protein